MIQPSVAARAAKNLLLRAAGRPVVHVATVVAGVALLKVVVSLQLELTSLEAYYWMYSRHPALGYFDHPALVGWLIRASTDLLGHSTLGVRAIFIALAAAGAWFMFLAGRRLHDERTGGLAALLVSVAPMTLQHGSMATPDAPLLFAWCGALWAISHILTGGSPRWWYAVGAFFGLGLQSKYSGVFIGVGALVLLLGDAGHRAWLRRREPWLAAVLALLMFSPTLVWNARHGWRSLAYQGIGRVSEGRGFDARSCIDFPLRQLLMLTPAACLAGWWQGLRALVRWRRAGVAARATAVQSMPLNLLMLALTLWRPVRTHWTAPAAPALLLGAAAVLVSGPRWVRVANTLVLLLLAIGLAAAPAAVALIPREATSGWQRLAERVASLSPDFVVARDYHDASQLGYRLRPLEAVDFTAIGRGGKSFPDWWRAERHVGGRAVIVYGERDYPDQLDTVLRHFERVADPVIVEVRRLAASGWVAERFCLVVADGYRVRVDR